MILDVLTDNRLSSQAKVMALYMANTPRQKIGDIRAALNMSTSVAAKSMRRLMDCGYVVKARQDRAKGAYLWCPDRARP